MPLSITVAVSFMPLVVRFVQFCGSPEDLSGLTYNENRDRAPETPDQWWRIAP